MKNNIRVSVIMASKSDSSLVRKTVKILKGFKVRHEVKILSAHRTPDDLIKYVRNLPARGIKVIIAAAGGSAALAGTIAAYSVLPVIGIPVQTKMFKGLDSLLSSVQMPKGIPVACMAIGDAGAQNAALFACQILALQDKVLNAKIVRFRKDMVKTIIKQK